MLSHNYKESSEHNETLASSRRRAEVLSALVRLFAQEQNPIELANQAVELVSRATAADSVFVYFWDEKLERLVLKIVTKSDINRGFEEVQVPLGVGITGWTALTHKSVSLQRELSADPRWMSFEAIDELDYKSVIAIPIIDKEVLYGVFALYSKEESKFDANDLALAEEVGTLLASGLQRAEKTEILRFQSAVARFLLDFPSSATISRTSALQEIATRVIEIMQIDACVIDYIPWLGANPEPIVFAQNVQSSQKPRVWLTHSRHLSRENIEKFETEYHDFRNVTLGFGSSRGVLSCYRNKKFSTLELERMNALATQIGILLESLGSNSTNLSTIARFMTARDDKTIERCLNELGWSMKPFIPVFLEVTSFADDLNSLTEMLREKAASFLKKNVLLIVSGSTILTLIEADNIPQNVSFNNLIEDWLNEIANITGLMGNVGIGKVSDQNPNLHFSITEAREALRWSILTKTQDQLNIIFYKDRELVNDLPALVGRMAPTIERIKEKLAIISSYDKKHGLELHETLQVYADQGGSILRSSKLLYIHRNTLRQRLDRIEQLLGEELPLGASWTELTLATLLNNKTPS